MRVSKALRGSQRMGVAKRTEGGLLYQPQLTEPVEEKVKKKVLVNNGQVRYNEYGIQMIPLNLRKQLFNTSCDRKSRDDKYRSCLAQLKKYNLGQKTEGYRIPEVNLPKLFGADIEQHFMRIADLQSAPYRELAGSLATKLPPRPQEWLLEEGWSRYTEGKVERLAHPSDNALFLDVEVCRSEGEAPTLAIAVSPTAWYGWVSGQLAASRQTRVCPEALIPLEGRLSRPRLVVAHSAGYDRARIREQYRLIRSGLRFLDTISLHVSVSGITSHQKALLRAGIDSDEWSKLSSLNSLSMVHRLYCGTEIAKEERELFIDGQISDVKKNFQSAMNYCASDVEATFNIFKVLWPMFQQRFPHPATLAGMLELQSAYIPVNHHWSKYLTDSQATYDDMCMEAKYLMAQIAKKSCHLLHEEKFKKDLWLWDQDWSIKKIKMKKSSTSDKSNNEFEKTENLTIVDSELNDLKVKLQPVLKTKGNLPAKSKHLPGYPQWYAKLCEKEGDEDWIPGPILLTNSMQVTPKILRLTWKEMPLHYIRGHGWGFIVPYETEILLNDNRFPVQEYISYVKSLPSCLCSCQGTCLNREKSDLFCRKQLGKQIGFIKLPHKDGSNLNVGNPLGRDFINKFSENNLSGSIQSARRVIEISRMLSYWKNNQDRIAGQIVCWQSDSEGAILPQVIVSGTLTRRAVEPTWMTASNALPDRVGSELRGVIHAPTEYCFVGADVDSQELWIASLLGDAFCAKSHGCTPFGWMTLNGQKIDKTDLHSVTAKAVNISRNHAKILNYARIYGAGQKFAERTLRNFNPDMSATEATEKSSKMYTLTKGKKMFVLKEGVVPYVDQRRYTRYQAAQLCRALNKNLEDLFGESQWFGGTESEMFNSLERIASEECPETPFLRGKLSRALQPKVDEDDKHGNTRVNWVVQSSAVDFLHLMLVSMRWLLGDSCRFSLSFHDEVRYLVPKSYQYRAAYSLHITNLLTRAFCASRLGLSDLPLSVAFFSAVDIDSVLRKESTDDNKTPSNPYGLLKGYGIPLGESLDIHTCITKMNQEIKDYPFTEKGSVFLS